MASLKPALAAHGATSLFVLLWSSGAIFAELGLRHACAFAFLIARFALASFVLLVLSLARRRWLPPPGARRATVATGLLLTGGYSILYLLALERGLAPGILATILGVQPILTLVVLERRASGARLAGLALALTGLSLVVRRSIALGDAPVSGASCALGALLAITAGALLQKRACEQGNPPALERGMAAVREHLEQAEAGAPPPPNQADATRQLTRELDSMVVDAERSDTSADLAHDLKVLAHQCKQMLASSLLIRKDASVIRLPE